MRKVTLNGGPLDGRTFLVPESADVFVHHAAHGGWYDVDGTWNPDAVVQLVPEAALAAARANVEGASIDGVGLEEFLPKGLRRVLAEARMGRRVLLVGHTLRAAREAFDELNPQATDASSVVRSAGKERITFPSGGWIVPVGVGTRGARGLSADVLYLLPEVTRTDARTLMPALAASTVGLVIDHADD